MQQVTIFRASRCTLTFREWMSKTFFSKNLWRIQNFFLSLPCQKIKCGTSAASSRWLFLYSQTSESNTAAPRRVSGNAPGSPAFETLTTRSAASLCQKSNVMATLTINRATRRTLTVKEWLSRKNECFSALCGEEFTNKHVLLAHLFCIGLIAACFVAEWLEGGAL